MLSFRHVYGGPPSVGAKTNARKKLLIAIHRRTEADVLLEFEQVGPDVRVDIARSIATCGFQDRE